MGFDTSDYTGNNFTPVPTGKYTVALVKAARKEAKTKGNYYLNCQFNVLKGKHKKRVIFHMFNLINNNDQAEEIGKNQLKELMMSVGVKKLPDMWNVEKLMNKPCEAQITIEEDKQYGDRNRISRFIFDKDDLPENDPMEDLEGKKKKGKKKKKKDKKDPFNDDVPF